MTATMSQTRHGFELIDGALRPSAAFRSEERRLVLPARIRKAEGEGVPEDFPGFDIVVTTEAPDSYGDVVLADGCDWSRFDVNPVITKQHDTNDPPIAKCVKRWPVETRVRTGGPKVKGWAQRWEFNVAKGGAEPDEIQSEAAAYLAAYRGGFMRAASIHFIPVKGGMKWAGEMTLEERQRYGIESEYGVLWSRCLIASVGCVTIPANEGAVMLSASRTCSARELKAMRGEMDSLRREVTDLRQLVLTKSTPLPAAPDATIAPDAEGEGRKDNGEPASGPTGVPTAPDLEPSPHGLAAFRDRLRSL